MATRREFSRHPLNTRHFRQVGCRPKNQLRGLLNVWACTWRPGGRVNSFLNNHFRPLGSPLMMVQSSITIDGQNEIIPLFGVAAQIDPKNGDVHYSDVKLRHRFDKRPFAGARGAVLDPRDEKDPTVRRQDRPNSTWVQTALEADRCRTKACDRRFRLESVPHLPEFYLGFNKPEAAKFEITETLKKRVYRALGESGENMPRERFAAMEPTMQESLLRAEWPSAFVKPGENGNDTGLYLLDQTMCSHVGSSARAFEYFGRLVGTEVWNPVRDLMPYRIENPAYAAANSIGLNLDESLTMVADESLPVEVREQREAAVVGLIPVMRKMLGPQSVLFTDDDLSHAVCQPGQQLIGSCEHPLEKLGHAEGIAVVRSMMRPHLSECCSDEDIAKAVAEPARPLYASGLCTVQVLHRDPSADPAEFFKFDPERLGRPRTHANLWANLEGTVPAEQPVMANA